jgi:hypothetical protein
MTAAPFTLCAWWCASAVLGAAPPPAGRAALDVSGGMSVLVPVAGAGVLVGLPARLAAGVRHDTYAGLAHVSTLSLRARVAERWAVGLDGSFGLFVSDDLFGVDLSRSPFARGVSLEPLVVHTRGLLALVAGASARLEDPALKSLKVAVTADVGPVFVRVQALVPLERDTRVLGYLPTVVVGKVWGL